MNSACPGSSGKQDSAQHRSKADSSKVWTGDFVLLAQVVLLETIFTVVARAVITWACIRERPMMRLQSLEIMRKRHILLRTSLDWLVHGAKAVRNNQKQNVSAPCLPPCQTPSWDVVEEGEVLPFQLEYTPLSPPRRSETSTRCRIALVSLHRKAGSSSPLPTPGHASLRRGLTPAAGALRVLHPPTAQGRGASPQRPLLRGPRDPLLEPSPPGPPAAAGCRGSSGRAGFTSGPGSSSSPAPSPVPTPPRARV